MKTLITLIIVALFTASVFAAEYVATTEDNTVTDRNAVQVQVTTQTEQVEYRTLRYLLTEVAAERTKRDAAIARLRALAEEIVLVEAEVDKVQLAEVEEIE